ncbi:MAG: hypothetical protein J3K34DRAFT_387134 [Monoraphidium minutum]|nr:MAG: hypothetical protein J3K34DRAFT_387134 [Monoraphidium minutum]
MHAWRGRVESANGTCWRDAARPPAPAAARRSRRPAVAALPVPAADAPAAAPQRGGKTAVVIGGGIGGLVVAGRLAQEGVRVTLLEQNEQVGGRCQSMHAGGFRWDTGPSLLLFPGTYRDTYSKLGTALEDHVDVRRVEPAAYRGFTRLDLLYDVQRMAQQLEAEEPGAGTEYVAWLADARRALVVGTENFIARDVEGWGQLLDPARLLPLLGRVDALELLGQHDARLARRFKDPRIRALLSFQDLYVGLSPYTAPGVFSLLAATEITDGVFYPMGGFEKVRDSLAAIAASHGAQLRTRARVARVMVEGGSSSNSSSSSSSGGGGGGGGSGGGGGGRVVGVELEGGEQLLADAVITNVDTCSPPPPSPPPTPHTRTHTNTQLPPSRPPRSAGVIAFNWAVRDYAPFATLAHHNVFLSGDGRASWRRARRPGDFVPHPNFYVHVPSKTDADAAPAGCHSVMVLLPVANMQERGGRRDYAELVSAGRAAVLRTLRAAGVADGGLEAAISHEVVIDPREWAARHALTHGAAFGLSHGLAQLSLLRPGPEDAALPGLFFVGASARPGNGVPLVMMGAEQCFGRVARALGLRERAAG